MDDISKYHFFLGGHDAEMLEIKNILEKHCCKYEDAQLQWDNAKLSAYQSQLAALLPDEIPVLIELKQDIEPPNNKVIIDHHGALAGADKKTSIEQVADRLNIELTRKQQLISANDRGHIRGMLAMGAEPEEIEEIRAKDREAQGINDQDYIYADEAIACINEPFKDVNVALIESKTKRTAAIVDKIWNKYQIIVIKAPDNEVHISGPGKLIDTLKKHYEALKKENSKIDFWSGGMLPSYGYFGANYYDKKGVLEMAEKEKTTISQHVFLFPFMIEHWDRDKGENVDLSDVYDQLTINVWGKYKKFSPFTTSQSYNEYGYFHDYARTALFGKLHGQKKNTEPSPCKFDLFSGKTPKFVSCLLHRCSGKGVLELRIKDEKDDTFKEETYKLTIDGVSLRLFETGIAILAIELLNYRYTDFKDIQRINDYGRRVYPQFLGSDNGHEINDVKNVFLADSIKITLNSPVEPENFLLGDFFISGHDHLHIGRHITSLMGDAFAGIYKIEPIIDDRMFTLCWHGNDALIAKFIVKEEDSKPMQEQPFESSQDWYRFIFLDGNNCNCQDERTLRSLIEASTYRRWSQWGTLYGVSRYSMVCLSGSGAPDFVKIHMRRQYRLMAEILLAQRATIITFFRRIADISKSIDERAEDNDDVSQERQQRDVIVKDIRKLNRDFLGFKNRLWFMEITPQEQGIEMYDMAMKNMCLEKQMEELKDEIKELYEYAEMQNDRFSAEENTKLNKRMLVLTILAAVAIPFSLIFAGWGLSKEFVEQNSWTAIFAILSNSPFVQTMILALIVSIAIIIGVTMCGNEGGNK